MITLFTLHFCIKVSSTYMTNSYKTFQYNFSILPTLITEISVVNLQALTRFTRLQKHQKKLHSTFGIVFSQKGPTNHIEKVIDLLPISFLFCVRSVEAGRKHQIILFSNSSSITLVLFQKLSHAPDLTVNSQVDKNSLDLSFILDSSL